MAQETLTTDLSTAAGARWEFRPEGGRWGGIRVPDGGWKTQAHSCDAGTYRTRLRIPAGARGKTVRLHFAAINFGAEIFVGPDEAGLVRVASHVNGWMPITVDLTPHVAAGRECLLQVAVKGRKKFFRTVTAADWGSGQRRLVSVEKCIVPEGAFWFEGLADGILRGVEMRVLPAVSIDEVFVRTSVDEDTLHPEAVLSNTSDRAVSGTIRPRLAAWGGRTFRYPALPPIPFTLEAGESRPVDLTPTPWGLGPESWWWPNVPYAKGYRSVLHNLEVTLEVGGQAGHRVTQRFGFRQFHAKGPHYYLNGVRCNLRGDNQQEANFGTNAYGTFPGFGPPSKTNAGWPGAVDNLLHANFNVLRIHQVPCTPYMLDVCDELGLMIVDETPVRGSEGMEDFVAGREHMIDMARELARRDRNHPSIVIWSAANEIWGWRKLALALQGAVWESDDTRPVIIDGVGDMGPELINMEHYVGGAGVLPDKGASPRTDRPYGETESVWPQDNSWQGFAWMATATRIRRLKQNADIRNYVLNNAWSNYVPGQEPSLQILEKKVKNIRWPQVTSDMKILPALKDMWNHPNLRLLQKCYHPVTVCDVAFDEANKASDVRGRWPVVRPEIPAGADVRRQLAVFNDTFADEQVEVAWEVRLGGPKGKRHAAGRTRLHVPLGEYRLLPIVFQAPSRKGTITLRLKSYKGGKVCFEDDLLAFAIV